MTTKISKGNHKEKIVAYKPHFTENPDFFRRLIDSLEGYAVFIINPNGRIVSWNSGAENILGYKEHEIVGKPYSTFFVTEERRKGIPQLELKNAIATHQTVNEGWRVRKNGEIFWATGFVFPFRDEKGNVVGFTKIMRDRTERKKLEQQKDIFISAVSHELKTPITSLKLFADILHGQIKEHYGDSSPVMESIGIIRDQVDKLAVLMNDLLDVSHVQSSTIILSPQAFDICELVREIVKQVQTVTLTHNIACRLPTESKKFVHADRVRIGQVVMNLVTNAIKYSPHKDEVVVRVKKKNDQVVVEVEDFGIGISEQEQQHVFERFYRSSHAKKKKITGLGLGLFISAAIIRRHGSKIQVKSTEGKGSVFSFSLPLIKQS